MRHQWRSWFGLMGLVCGGWLPSVATADDAPAAAGRQWWAHVEALANDGMEGRDTGSPAHRRAAEYVAGQFQQLGLQPAGTEGFIQPVRFRTKTIDEAKSSLTLIRPDGTTTPLTLGDDAIISLRVDPAAAVDAPLVFVGHGLRHAEAQVDDFAGLDVRGKIVVYLAGAPGSVPGALAAHMQSAGERGAVLRSLGVVGTVAIANPKNMDIPWERSSLARFLPSMSLADPSMDDNRGLQLGVAVNPARAEKLFEGSGQTFAAILAAADANAPLPRFAIPSRLKAEVAVTRAEVISQNVAAILPGTDPERKQEYVACTAHLDHLGIGRPIGGDAIYNGAMDNASGVASLLDVARRLIESKAKLGRSVLFVAVTGEEKGLLGSRYFAGAPTVEPGTIVANINSDMFLPLFPLRKLTVYGLAESDLGADIQAVAAALNLSVEPDPEPRRNVFIRSDQYSFIRKGIPALAMKVGFDKGSPEEQIAKKWLTERYHAPADDLNQPVDLQAADRFDTVLARLVERIANRPDRPAWKSDSFFRRFVGAP